MKMKANFLNVPQILSSVVVLATSIGILVSQVTTAEITGRITDQSDAVVPGVEVTITNTDTGVVSSSVSNDLGYYSILLLPPGNYKLEGRLPGFRTVSRTGISLHVNQSARLDLVLQVGEVTDTVTVTGNVSLLESNTSALGALVDNSKIENLPLIDRDPLNLVSLTPGTVFYGKPDFPGNNIPLTNFSTNGGPPLTNEVLLDGIPNTVPQFNQAVIIPPPEALQEFKVQSNNYSAEFGRSGGGVVNIIMKQGTNRFHGTLWEFFRNDVLDANNWFNNRAGKERPPLRFNKFGGTLGGPIIKDKTFFFVTYEGLRRRRGKTFVFSIPTLEMRKGDFSQIRTKSGQPVQIFDPRSTRRNPTGTGLVRDPFPNNIIPEDRIDPVAKKLLEFWPLPNQPGDPRTGANNFISTAPEKFDTNQFTTRIDHHTLNHQLFGRFSWNESEVTPPNVFENIANPASGPQLFTQRNVGFRDIWTINPETTVSFELGFTRLRDSGEPLGLGTDITNLGFPSNFANFQTMKAIPQISITGMTVSDIGFGTSSLGPVGGALLNNITNQSSAAGTVTHTRGSHIFKFGGEYRLFRFNGTRPIGGGGNFNFNPGFTQGPDPRAPSPQSGASFASFLLGTPADGSIVRRDTQNFQSYHLAFFLQDDWKVTPQLTVNLGLRWSVEPFLTDRFDRLSFLDFSSPSPVQVPELGRQLVGGLGFVGTNGHSRQLRETNFNQFAPRIGFAYRPFDTFVIRGGYGIFYLPIMGRSGEVTTNTSQQGFSAPTPFVSSIDGFTPLNFLRNPFPGGFNQPTRSSLGLLTNIGQSAVSLPRDQASSYMQQWNFGLQKTFGGDFFVEVAYAGSKGTHLPGTLQFNQIPDQFLAMGNSLLERIPNPFFGLFPAATPLGQKTIIRGQLLRPFPQFTGFGAPDSTFGSSIYHSVQVRAEHRFSKGFSLLASYTGAKLIDDGQPGRFGFLGQVPGFQNNRNIRAERSLSSQEVPQRFVVSYVWDLPVGAGKRFLGDSQGVWAAFLGGWRISGISSFQSGIPLVLRTATNPTLGRLGSGGLRPDNNGRSAKLTGPSVKRLNEFFDTSVFSQPPPFEFGNTARTLPDVRTPGFVNFDFSLSKNTRIAEGHMLQFRAEFFNLFNNTNFGAPGTTFGTPTFGVISSAAPARQVQFALKWIF